jgi:hypothetical protein
MVYLPRIYVTISKPKYPSLHHATWSAAGNKDTMGPTWFYANGAIYTHKPPTIWISILYQRRMQVPSINNTLSKEKGELIGDEILLYQKHKEGKLACQLG